MACCKPVYTSPTFNLTCAIWRQANPRTNPPDDIQPCNLSPGKQVGIAPPVLLDSQVPIGGMWIKMPKEAVIFDGASPLGMDVIECPRGTGRFYTANWTDVVAYGFANQHVFVYAQKMIPFPGGGGGTPPPPPPPPPPLPPAFIWLATSPPPIFTLGPALILPFVSPGAGCLHVRVCAFSGGGISTLQANIGGPNIGGESGQFQQITTMGNTANIASFLFPGVGAGPLVLTVSDFLAFNQYWFVQIFYRPVFAPLVWYATNSVGFTPPATYSATGSVQPFMDSLSSVFEIASVPLSSYPLPWTLIGTDASGLAPLINCRFGSGTSKIATTWFPNFVMVGGSNSGWVANHASYFP